MSAFRQLLRLDDTPIGQNHMETFSGKAFGAREAYSRARSDAEKCLHLLFPMEAALETGYFIVAEIIRPITARVFASHSEFHRSAF
jgi:hypothetical protein